MAIKNKSNILATPNFFSISMNGERIKTVFSIGKIGTSKSIEKANEQLNELKWGVHENKEIQNKFDSVLDK